MHDVTPSTAQESVTAQVDMKLAGTRFQLTLAVPTTPVPPRAILPALQTVRDAAGFLQWIVVGEESPVPCCTTLCVVL
jgi:hypothetical protein